MTRNNATKERILDATTRIMGKQGIDRVSIRKALGAAGMNQALGHYYFSGRDGLIEAVVSRPATTLVKEWTASLSEFETEWNGSGRWECAVKAFLYPVIRLGRSAPDQASVLLQLLTNPDPFSRRLAGSLFHRTLWRFTRVLLLVNSGQPSEAEISANTDLLGGALLLALSKFAHVDPGLGQSFSDCDAQRLFLELESFVEAGLPNPATGQGRRAVELA